MISLVLSLGTTLTIAANEFVVVTKAMDDKAIVTRNDGTAYLIEKGTGCLSLWRYEGKSVLIVSPTSFLGSGAELMIPELDQKCRIWSAEPLGSMGAKPPTATPNPPKSPTSTSKTEASSSVASLQKALKIVGLDPGGTDGVFTPETANAFDRYRISKGLEASNAGVYQALVALATDVSTRRPNDPQALQISIDILKDVSNGPAPSAPTPSSPEKSSDAPKQPTDCESGHRIKSVSGQGEIVILEDGTVWQVSSIDRIDSTLWLQMDDIVVCDGRLVNTDQGETVDAKRVK